MTKVEAKRALNLDLPDQEAFIRSFKKLPEKPATTIRIFSRDDYYTLHGDDAEFAAAQVFKSLGACKTMGELEKLKYVCLSRGNFELFLRELLLVKQYRVEVYVNQGSAKNNNWIVEYKGSPGNLSQFENILFNSDEIVVNTCLIAVRISMDKGSRVVGVSSIDENAHQFRISEFNDNELFSELEALVVQLAPKECLIQKTESKDYQRIDLVMSRNNILVTKIPPKDFTNENLEQDLNRLLYFKENQSRNCKSIPELGQQLAAPGLGALIKYLNLINQDSNFNQYKILGLDLKQFVHLDAAGVKSLNILPPVGVTAAPQNSILGLLDCCRTAQGHRLIAHWVKQPLRDLNIINERLDIVQALFENVEVRSALHNEYLRGIPDLQTISKKIMHKKAKLQDCFRIYQAVGRLPLMLRELRKVADKSVKLALVDPLNDLLIDMDKYQQMIEQTLDLEAADRGEFLVKPSFDDDLKTIYDERVELEEKMNNVLIKAGKELDLDNTKIKLDSTSQHGFFLRVTLNNEPLLRKNKKFEIIDAIKGGVRFTTEKLQSLNQDYTENREQYEQKQKNAVEEIVETAATYTLTITSLNAIIAKIDVLVSFAQVSANASIPYTRPQMLDSSAGILDLKKVRHPCIESQPNISYIANDCYFKNGEQIFQIITGPNMGGKSTYIRSVGVTALLAHIGCFVPCDEAKISLFDAILARIGADDEETKGLSTFMVEMIESAGIVRSVTENSLVIIDELGRGTSTYEGCGIAWAIADYLVEANAFTLFATHFQELTRLADSNPLVKNRHVTALINSNDEFTLLYQIRDGACDKSYGIHLARMIGFPDEVLDEAVKIHAELDPSTNMDENITPDEKRKYVKEAHVYIQDILKNLTSLKDNSSKDEIKRKIEDLQRSGKSHSNPFIKSISTFNAREFLQKLNGQKNGINNHEQTIMGGIEDHELSGVNFEDFDD